MNTYTAGMEVEVEVNNFTTPILAVGQPLIVNANGKFELWNGVGNMIGVVLSPPLPIVNSYARIRLISDHTYLTEEELEEGRIS